MRFNVIGHVSSEIGLGIMAADLVRALTDAGHEVRALDVDLGYDRRGRNHDLDRYCVSEHRLYRDGVDVSVFPISAVDHWRRYRFGRRRVAVPLWELPDVNPKWVSGLREFDAIWAPSEFIADTLERAGLNVTSAPWPHYLPDPPSQMTRQSFGLPDDAIVFTFAFDPSSDVRRKNPGAVVEAFMRAGAPGSVLCIQLNRSSEKFVELDRWLGELPPDRVRVINRHLSHAEAVRLIAVSDVYVSLHRAEGLGLGMLEAMMLGKPVIATGWSGNLSFMDAGSACLVDATLTTLDGTIPAYTAAEIGCESRWAEPSVDEAARWMRALMEQAARGRIGQAAEARASEYLSEARELRWIDAPSHAARPPGRATKRRRLLIYTPTWKTSDGLAFHPMCRAAIETQQIAPDVAVEFVIGTDNPHPIGDHRNVLHQYQQARERLLAGPYDALLTVEHDNLLPDSDAVQRLLDTPGDVIYAPYLLRHGMRVLNTWQYINDRNLGMSLSHYRDELRRAREAAVWRISGAGFGCTLIRRHVLEQIEFTGATPRDQNQCPDLRFAEDCLRNGFAAYGRFDAPVMHWDGDTWLHPFQNRRNRMAKYTALESVNVIAAGRWMRLTAGETVDLSDEEAAELTRLGVIRRENVPAPEIPEPVQADAPTRRSRARASKE